MLCAIYHHLHNLAKLEKHPCRNVTKINTSPWVLFKFFKLYKWYQIVQRITYEPPAF